MDELAEKIRAYNAEALRKGAVTMACGMARFGEDVCVASVFERADHNMYEDKKAMKAADVYRNAANDSAG